MDYQNGVFVQTEITCYENLQNIKNEICASESKYQLADRNYSFLLHLDKNPEFLIFNGIIRIETSEENTVKTWIFNSERNILELTVLKKS